MVSGALDNSSDDSTLPRDYRGAVQYRYVLIGAGIGYALPRITLYFVGGRFGLTLGRSIGVALFLGCIGLTAWSWRLLTNSGLCSYL